MLGELIWQSGLVVVSLWWLTRVSRNLIRAIGLHAQAQADDVLQTLYPVFSKDEVCETYRRAMAATKDLQRVEAATLNDSKFKEAAQQRAIPEDVARRMLEVCEATTKAEKWWYRHSVTMDANIRVLTGDSPRNAALDDAIQKLKATYEAFSLDAETMRDQWKLRLEGRTSENPSPRPYSNPWFEQAKQQHHWARV
jgi:hypothetical protein